MMRRGVSSVVLHVWTPGPIPSNEFNCAVPLYQTQSIVLPYIRSLCEAPIAVQFTPSICTPCGQLWLALITIYRRTLTAVIHHPRAQHSKQSPPSWPPSVLWALPVKCASPLISCGSLRLLCDKMLSYENSPIPPERGVVGRGTAGYMVPGEM